MKIKLVVIALVSLFAINPASADDSTEVQKVEQKNSCGVLAVYDKTPQTKSIFHAGINSIDGKTVNTNSRSFALSPGKHIIKVIENIVDPRFTRRRGEMMNYKFIEINIEANKKYSLGAKYIRKNRSKLKTGEYWDPVVWKVTEKACKV